MYQGVDFLLFMIYNIKAETLAWKDVTVRMPVP